jgi:hypothetical protein
MKSCGPSVFSGLLSTKEGSAVGERSSGGAHASHSVRERVLAIAHFPFEFATCLSAKLTANLFRRDGETKTRGRVHSPDIRELCWRVSIAAGTANWLATVIDFLSSFRFTETEVAYLAAQRGKDGKPLLILVFSITCAICN